MWVRVDNRLVHGQVIEAWLPYSGCSALIVANDELAGDLTRQMIMELAIPRSIKVFFVSLEAVAKTLLQTGDESFLLFADCRSARKVFEFGICFSCLNLGNLHYSQGKEQLCDHIALGQEDFRNLRFLRSRGVELDFRCVPNQTVNISLD